MYLRGGKEAGEPELFGFRDLGSSAFKRLFFFFVEVCIEQVLSLSDLLGGHTAGTGCGGPFLIDDAGISLVFFLFAYRLKG